MLKQIKIFTYCFSILIIALTNTNWLSATETKVAHETEASLEETEQRRPSAMAFEIITL